MADKKPIYNPPTSGDSTGATSKKADASTNQKTGVTGRRLSTGVIIGISAAGAGALLLAGVAGASISAAVAHGDRDHGQFQQMPGQPADFEGGRHHEGDRDGDGPGQMPGGQMPGGQMPGGQMPGGQLPGGQGPDGQMPGQMPAAPTPTATPSAN